MRFPLHLNPQKPKLIHQHLGVLAENHRRLALLDNRRAGEGRAGHGGVGLIHDGEEAAPEDFEGDGVKFLSHAFCPAPF